MPRQLPNHLLYVPSWKRGLNRCENHRKVVCAPINYIRCTCERKVLPRYGEWPFFDGITIIQSDYVDPIGTSKWSKEWRKIHLGERSEYRNCLYGIVERYVLRTKYSNKQSIAWVHRDANMPEWKQLYIGDSWPLEKLRKRLRQDQAIAMATHNI